LPVIAALAAHAGALGRWYVPCRTVAWVLLPALLPGVAAFRIVGKGHSLIGPALAWLLAAIVLGWRLAKAGQDSRQGSQLRQVRGAGPPVPVAWSPTRPMGPGMTDGYAGQVSRGPTLQQRPAATPAGRPANAEGARVMAAARSARGGVA